MGLCFEPYCKTANKNIFPLCLSNDDIFTYKINIIKLGMYVKDLVLHGIFNIVEYTIGAYYPGMKVA